MNTQRVLVTGASGTTGSLVLAGLAARGESVAAALGARHFSGSTNPAAEIAPANAPGDVTSRRFDFTQASTWGPALDGVDRLFLLRPPHIANVQRDMEPFLAAVAAHGVRHVAFLSVQGAETNSLVPHHKIERAIIAHELPYSFFRPSFFMQNLTTTHLQEIRDEHRIFVPAGDGRTNFVDVRDIAEAIVATLIEPPRDSTSFTITGDQELTYAEVAELLSSHLPYDVRYQPARLLPFLRYNLRRGRPLRQALVMYALYSVTRMGKAGRATPDLRSLLGHPPRTLEQFILDHQDRFLQNGLDETR
jgi:uncharacterized protein YbjT (DUF2867 family)